MKKFVVIFLILIVSLIVFIGHKIDLGYYKLYINSNNELVIGLFDNNILCQLTENELDDNNWKQSVNKQCIYSLEDKPYKLYIKFNDGNIKEIKEVQNLGKIIKIELNTSKIYLALNESYDLKLDIEAVGNVDKTYNWTSTNNEVVEIKNNQIIGASVGNTIIETNFNHETYKVEVVVTDKILAAPQKYDANKKYLECNVFSEEDNDLIDEILKYKINNVGYKTRAAAVEAARFLTLNFPYKINYFYENGRATTYGVKPLAYGEGRYYNEGLYLHESRYKNILKSVKGPATWGCDLYSKVEGRTTGNGLNCSGFVAWVLKNAGYDPGDIGAGITSVFDFTDISKKEKLTNNLIKGTTIKSGDLLYSSRVGGHIAIIVGIDDTNYYVAEAYWDVPRGVVINTYKKSNVTDYFSYVILMDEYYQNEGNYTELWY